MVHVPVDADKYPLVGSHAVQLAATAVPVGALQRRHPATPTYAGVVVNGTMLPQDMQAVPAKKYPGAQLVQTVRLVPVRQFAPKLAQLAIAGKKKPALH